MLPKDVDAEIERLKIKKIEIANRINLTSDFEEKEELRREVERIQAQIEILEKLRTKF
jgi:hypothetical protein